MNGALDPAADAIVVGVDGTAPSVAALRWAAAQSDFTGAALRAVLVWQYPALSGLGTLPAPGDPETAARRLLQRTVTHALGPARAAATQLLTARGSPADVLVTQARGSGLLVLGTDGGRRLTTALFGSVVQRCVRHATVAVVVVSCGDEHGPRRDDLGPLTRRARHHHPVADRAAGTVPQPDRGFPAARNRPRTDGIRHDTR